MRLSSNRQDCERCAVTRRGGGPGGQSRGARRRERPRLLYGRQILDLQGGSVLVLLLSLWNLPAASAQRSGRFRPTRSRDPSRGSISSSRRGRRAGLLQAWPCFLVSRVTSIKTLPASLAISCWPLFGFPCAHSNDIPFRNERGWQLL